jgi:hypothetical protein
VYLFYLKWHIHCFIKGKITAGEKSLVDSPKEQRPRKLSGKRTVVIVKPLERSHSIENKKEMAHRRGR